MEKALEVLFGSGAAVIIATMAKPCGQRLCEKIMEKADTKEKALEQFCELMIKQNWGEPSFFNVDFKNGSGRVTVRNSFETRRRRTNAPCCHFLRNFMAGFLSELFAKSVMVTEQNCAGEGKPYCEFKL